MFGSSPFAAVKRLDQQALPVGLSVLLPLGMVLYPCATQIPLVNWEHGLDREHGFIENLTALLLLAACLFFVQAWRGRRDAWQGAWLVLWAIGSFFFLGEEISWGQHYLGWETPDWLKGMNRQAETNLHNLRGSLGFFLNRGCSAALSLAVLILGLGSLGVAWWRCLWPEARVHPIWLWPPASCALTALLSAAVRLPRLISGEDSALDLPPLYGVAMGELKEGLQALFILLYALSQRQMNRGDTSEVQDAACMR